MAYEARAWTNDGGMALSAENLNIIEEAIASCSKEIEDLQKDFSKLLNPDIIWVNSASSDEFGSTEISENLSEYKRFSILFKQKKSSSSQYIEYQVSQKNIPMYFAVENTTSYANEYGRTITFKNDKIEISNVLKNGTASDSYNGYAIPVKIIGYKY